jgi:deazaflavin-dependent oxidoreductase (nitroreductase family)
MMDLREGDRLFVFAFKGGAPSHPDWYRNLLANLVATVEVGAERFQVRASSTVEPERSQLYAKMVEMMPGFALVLGKTRRTIPVLTLMRIASAQE